MTLEPFQKISWSRTRPCSLCSLNFVSIPHFHQKMTWTGSAIFPLCLTEFHFVLHIFRKFRISAFCQYLHCLGFSQHKKSYGHLKVHPGRFTYLSLIASYIYIYHAKQLGGLVVSQRENAWKFRVNHVLGTSGGLGGLKIDLGKL